MKLTTVFFSLFLMFHSNIISQSFNIEWQGCYGGNAKEYPYDILQVPDGYLVAGGTKSDNGDISYNHGATDCWLFKTNNTGELLWEKTYGGSFGDGIFRIFHAEENNYYLVGTAYSSDGDISNDPFPESADYWILKVDSNGEIIWDKILGGNSDEQIWTGTRTNDGGVIACGWTASNDGDISTYYGLYDVWLVKVNSNGEKEWDFTIGTDGQDVGQAIIQTSDGGYLVGCASVIWDVGNITCEPFNSYSEAVLVKLDADRNIEWQQCYGGSDNDGVTALAEVSDGYIFGGYASSNDGDISGWHGEGDIWIVKVDFFGNIIWQKCLGGSNSEFLYKLIITTEEDIIIPGTTRSTDGDVTGNHTISEFEHDIWLVKLNSEGDLLWERCFGGIWDDQVNFGFLKKGDSDFVIAGQTDYGPSFDVACTPHGGLYDKDFWVFEIKDTLVGFRQEASIENKLKVYPNPARDYVVFSTYAKASVDEGEVIIFDVFGQQVARLDIKSKKTVWDTRNVKNAIYFYNLEIDDNVFSGKVVVRK